MKHTGEALSQIKANHVNAFVSHDMLEQLDHQLYFKNEQITYKVNLK